MVSGTDDDDAPWRATTRSRNSGAGWMDDEVEVVTGLGDAEDGSGCNNT